MVLCNLYWAQGRQAVETAPPGTTPTEAGSETLILSEFATAD